MGRDADAPRCSFCGRAEQEVRRLIAGEAGVFICERCVAAAGELLDRPAGKPAG